MMLASVFILCIFWNLELTFASLVERPNLSNVYEASYKDFEDYEDQIPVNSLPGVPGKDFPIFHSVPPTGFSCIGKMPGFYADEETGCQVWHYCRSSGRIDSFLCPNGTIYNQGNRVCDWWFNVRCENTEAAFWVNDDLYIIPPSSPSPPTGNNFL